MRAAAAAGNGHSTIRAVNGEKREGRVKEEERELPYMPSANFLDFFDPLPPCSHSELIHSIEFLQLSLLWLLFRDPPPLFVLHVICGRTQREGN